MHDLLQRQLTSDVGSIEAIPEELHSLIAAVDEAYAQAEVDCALSARSTERKRAEDQLRERTERLAEAQHLTRLGSWEWEVTKKIVTWSDELFWIFGIEPEQLGARFEAYMECVYPDERGGVGKDVERGLEEKRTFTDECGFVKKKLYEGWGVRSI